MASVAWSVEKVAELIDMYETFPCLYNVKHKEYHDRDQRSKAIAAIAAALDVSGMCVYTVGVGARQ